MGNCKSKPPVQPYDFAQKFEKIVKYDDVEQDYKGNGTVFYEDVKSLKKFVPYLQSNPSREVLVEIHSECPSNCTDLKCGKCNPPSQCNNIKYCNDKGNEVIRFFKDNGCRNQFNYKSWGCTHPEIKNNDLVRISMPPPTPPKQVEPTPLPPAAAISKEEEEAFRRRQEELKKKEAALQEAEEELNRKRIAEANAAKADDAARRQKEQELAKRDAELKAAEEALQRQMAEANAALEAEKRKLEAARADSQKRAEEEEERLRQAAQKAIEAAEAKKKADETAEEEAERRRQAYLAAAAEAERRLKQAMEAAKEAERKKQSAEEAAKLAELKKREFEKAARDAAAKKEADEAAVEQIRREIEEAMKEQIEFVQNKADITSQGKAIVNKVVPFLLKWPNIPINIESHTNCFKGKCKEGCILSQLSQDRVDSVKEYLLAAGCRNKFSCRGWGCKHPELKNVRLVRIYPASTAAIISTKQAFT